MRVFEIPIADQLAEVDRELKLREVVYPRWINAPRPKLSPRSADLQMGRLKAVRESLVDLERCRPALELMAGAAMRDWSPEAGTVTLHFKDADAVLGFMMAYDAACYPVKVPAQTPASPAVPQ